MNELDVEGVFWLASAPDEQVAGRLRFDLALGAELNLIGAFGDIHKIARAAEPVRILGIAGKKLLTLDQCLRSSSAVEFPGITRQRYRPAFVLSGAHFEEDDPLEFSAAAIELRHLEHWIQRSAVEVQMTQDAASEEITEASITLKPIAKSTATTAHGDLELGFGWRLSGDHIVDSRIEQDSFLRLLPPAPATLEALLEPCLAVQHLVTLGVETTSSIERLWFWHQDHVHQLPSGRTVHEPIEFYGQLQGGDAPPASRNRQPHEMLFSFEDIGGLDGIARWIEVVSLYEQVVGVLLGQKYMAKMYMENRLQNMAYAAETFDRLRFPNRVRTRAEFRSIRRDVLAHAPRVHHVLLRELLQYANEPRLKHRLERLAEFAGRPFQTLVGDVPRWVNEFKNARNASVHRNSKPESTKDGELLYLLSESGFYLVVLCLLRESGVPDSTLARIGEHQRFLWLAKRLRQRWPAT